MDFEVLYASFMQSNAGNANCIQDLLRYLWDRECKIKILEGKIEALNINIEMALKIIKDLTERPSFIPDFSGYKGHVDI